MFADLFEPMNELMTVEVDAYTEQLKLKVAELSMVGDDARLKTFERMVSYRTANRETIISDSIYRTLEFTSFDIVRQPVGRVATSKEFKSRMDLMTTIQF